MRHQISEHVPGVNPSRYAPLNMFYYGEYSDADCTDYIPVIVQ